MYPILVWALCIGLIYSYKAHSHVFPLFDWNIILESVQNGDFQPGKLISDGSKSRYYTFHPGSTKTEPRVWGLGTWILEKKNKDKIFHEPDLVL